jgi:hypothetical protein
MESFSEKTVARDENFYVASDSQITQSQVTTDFQTE